MNNTHLEQELGMYFKILSQDRVLPQNFELLFKLYTQSETVQLSNLDGKSTEVEALAKKLEQTQDNLIELSSQLPAKSMDDILFKMALWRRHAAQIDPFDATMTGDEKLGYSVFRDLAFMCQRDDVFTNQDKQYLSSR